MSGISWSSALLCLTLACGGAERASEPEAPQADPSQARRAPAAAADNGFPACPDDTSPASLEIAAVETILRWCDKPGATGARVQHGPWEKQRGSNVVERGAYREGLRHGTWTLYWSSGEPQSEGQYADGERVGSWTFWREDGSEIQRTDYGSAATRDAATVVWEPEVEEEAEPAGDPEAVTLRFENGGGADLMVAVEPASEEWAVPPGTSVQVQARGEGAGDLVVEATDDGIVIWAGDRTETVTSSGDEELPAEQSP